jgi:hypothetical protein
MAPNYEEIRALGQRLDATVRALNAHWRDLYTLTRGGRKRSQRLGDIVKEHLIGAQSFHMRVLPPLEESLPRAAKTHDDQIAQISALSTPLSQSFPQRGAMPLNLKKVI